ncbi:hypothetical protein BB561_005605, partial [Smittium simulii]
MSLSKKIKLSHSKDTFPSTKSHYDPSTKDIFALEPSNFSETSSILDNSNDFVETFSTKNFDLLLIRFSSFRKFLSKMLKIRKDPQLQAEYEHMLRQLCEWDDRSNHFAILFDVTSELDLQDNPKFAKAFFLLLNKLLDVLSHKLLSNSGITVSKAFWSKNSPLILFYLSNNSSPAFLPLLQLLSSIASYKNPIISNEIIKFIHANPKISKKIAFSKNDFEVSELNSQSTSSSKIRPLWTTFVLFLLQVATTHNKEFMLDRFGLVNSLFNFLPYLSYTEVASTLLYIHNYILCDQKIKRKFRTDFICGNAFDQLVKLLNNTDHVPSSEFLSSLHLNHVSFSDHSNNLLNQITSTSDSIADFSYRFLLDIICTKDFIFSNQMHYFLFDFSKNSHFSSTLDNLPDFQSFANNSSNPATLSSSISLNTSYLSQKNIPDLYKVFRLITTKIKHTLSKKHYMLSIQILQTYPQLVPSFWKIVKFSTESRLSLVFLSNISFILNIMTIDSLFLKLDSKLLSRIDILEDIDSSILQSTNSIVEYMLPCQFNRLLLSKGVQHTSSNLVQYMILLIISKSLQNISLLRNRIKITIDTIRAHSLKTHSSIFYKEKAETLISNLTQLEAKVLQTVKRRLPEWSVILSIYRSTQLASKNQKSDNNQQSLPLDNTLNPSSNLFLESILRVISGYNKHYPEWILESRFDLLKLFHFESSDLYGPHSIFPNLAASSTFNSEKYLKLLQLQHIIDCLNYTNKDRILWFAESSIRFKAPNFELLSFPTTNFGILVSIFLSQSPTTNKLSKNALIKCIVDSEVLNQSDIRSLPIGDTLSKASTSNKLASAIVDSLYFSCNVGGYSKSSIARVASFSHFFENVYCSFYKDIYKYIDLTSKCLSSASQLHTSTVSENQIANIGLFLSIFIEKWISNYFSILKFSNNLPEEDYSLEIVKKSIEIESLQSFLFDKKIPDLSALFWLRDIITRFLGIYGTKSILFFNSFLKSCFDQCLDFVITQNQTSMSDQDSKFIFTISEITRNVFDKVMNPIYIGFDQYLIDCEYEYVSSSDNLIYPEPSANDLNAIKILAKFFYNFEFVSNDFDKLNFNDCISSLSTIALTISCSSQDIITQELTSLYKSDKDSNKNIKLNRIAIWYIYGCKLSSISQNALESIYPEINQELTTIGCCFAESIFTQLIFSNSSETLDFSLNQHSIVSKIISQPSTSNNYLGGLLYLVFYKIQCITRAGLNENYLSLRARSILYDYAFDFIKNRSSSNSKFSSLTSFTDMNLPTIADDFENFAEIFYKLIVSNLDISGNYSKSSIYQNYCSTLFLNRMATTSSCTIKNSDFSFDKLLENTISKLNISDDHTIKKTDTTHLITLICLILPLIDIKCSEKILFTIQENLDINNYKQNNNTFGIKISLLYESLIQITKRNYKLDINKFSVLIETLIGIYTLEVSSLSNKNSNILYPNPNQFNNEILNNKNIAINFSKTLLITIRLFYVPEVLDSSNLNFNTTESITTNNLTWPSDKIETTLIDSSYIYMNRLVAEKFTQNKVKETTTSSKESQSFYNEANLFEKFVSILPQIVNAAFDENETFILNNDAKDLLKILIVLSPSIKNALIAELSLRQTANENENNLSYSTLYDNIKISILVAYLFIENICTRYTDGAIRFNIFLSSNNILADKSNSSNSILSSKNFGYEIELLFALGKHLNTSGIYKQLFSEEGLNDKLKSNSDISKNYVSQLSVVYEAWLQNNANYTDLVELLEFIKKSEIFRALKTENFYQNQSNYENKLLLILSIVSSITFGFIRVNSHVEIGNNCVFDITSLVLDILISIKKLEGILSENCMRILEISILFVLTNVNTLLNLMESKHKISSNSLLNVEALKEYCSLVMSKYNTEITENVNIDICMTLGYDFKITVILLLLLCKSLNEKNLDCNSKTLETLPIIFSDMLIKFINHPQFLHSAYRSDRNIIISYISIMWSILSKLRLEKKYCLLSSKITYMLTSCYNGTISASDDVLLKLFYAYESRTEISLEDAIMSFGYKNSISLAKEQISNYHYGYDTILESKQQYILNELTPEKINSCIANIDSKKANRTAYSFYPKELDSENDLLVRDYLQAQSMQGQNNIELINSTENLILNSVHSSNLIKSNQNLEINSDIYNPRFLLKVFCSALSIDNGVDMKLLIKKNCLGLAFAAISSKCISDRIMGYYILTKILYLITHGERIEGRNQLKALLVNLQNSIDVKYKRIPYIISIFLLNSALIITRPDHKLYKFINKTILKSPKINLNSIPSFIGTIFPDNELTNDLRAFLFKIASFGSASYFTDRVIFQKFFVYEQMFSFDISPIVNNNLFDSSSATIALFNLSMKQNSLSLHHAMDSRDGLLATWIRQRISLIIQRYQYISGNFIKSIPDILICLGSILANSRLLMRILANSPTLIKKKPEDQTYESNQSTNIADCFDFYSYWVGSDINQSCAGSNFILDTSASILENLQSIICASEKERFKLSLEIITTISATLDSILSTVFMFVEMQLLKDNTSSSSSTKLNTKFFSQLILLISRADEIQNILGKNTILAPTVYLKPGFESISKDTIIKSCNIEILTQTSNIYSENISMIYSTNANITPVFSQYFYYSSSCVTLFKLLLLAADSIKNDYQCDLPGAIPSAAAGGPYHSAKRTRLEVPGAIPSAAAGGPYHSAKRTRL